MMGEIGSGYIRIGFGPICSIIPDEPLVWRPRELVLVHSHQGAGRRVVLGRWRLLG